MTWLQPIKQVPKVKTLKRLSWGEYMWRHIFLFTKDKRNEAFITFRNFELHPCYGLINILIFRACF